MQGMFNLQQINQVECEMCNYLYQQSNSQQLRGYVWFGTTVGIA
jgi:hypothetical protein